MIKDKDFNTNELYPVCFELSMQCLCVSKCTVGADRERWQGRRLERSWRQERMDYRERKEDDEEAMDGRDGGSLLSQTLCIAVLTIRD